MFKQKRDVVRKKERDFLHQNPINKIFAARHGFTLIEVSLFLAISGMLLVGIIAGMQNSIYTQRFSDSVQNYAEFLRSIYSEVSNPQSTGDGRSDIAIYGKLVVFGETRGLSGEAINNEYTQTIYVYDVIGNVAGASNGTGSATSMLRTLGANVIRATAWNELGQATEVEAMSAESYSPRWSASVEGISMRDGQWGIKGSLLVVRHPRSGTISTLWSDDVIEVNEAVSDFNAKGGLNSNHRVWSLLSSELGWLDDNGNERDLKFQAQEINFCINPYGLGSPSELRRNIRLTENARNASAVETIDQDSSDNKCRNISD